MPASVFVQSVARFAEKTAKDIRSDSSDASLVTGYFFLEVAQELLRSAERLAKPPYDRELLAIARAAFDIGLKEYRTQNSGEALYEASEKFYVAATKNLIAAVGHVFKGFERDQDSAENHGNVEQALKQAANLITSVAWERRIDSEEAMELRDKWAKTFEELLAKDTTRAKAAFDHAWKRIQLDYDPVDDDTDFRGTLLLLKQKLPSTAPGG